MRRRRITSCPTTAPRMTITTTMPMISPVCELPPLLDDELLAVELLDVGAADVGLLLVAVLVAEADGVTAAAIVAYGMAAGWRSLPFT